MGKCAHPLKGTRFAFKDRLLKIKRLNYSIYGNTIWEQKNILVPFKLFAVHKKTNSNLVRFTSWNQMCFWSCYEGTKGFLVSFMNNESVCNVELSMIGNTSFFFHNRRGSAALHCRGPMTSNDRDYAEWHGRQLVTICSGNTIVSLPQRCWGQTITHQVQLLHSFLQASPNLL